MLGEETDLRTPRFASDISVEWLASALPWRRAGCESVSAEVEPDFGGPSLLGRIARVRLGYATPGCGPDTILVKFQARCSDWEAQIHRLLSEAEAPSVPRLYGAFACGTLAMEDLSPSGPRTQLGGCTLQQAWDVLALLAEIHGRFWGDPRVPSVPPERFARVIDVNMTQCWGPFQFRYRDILGAVAAEFEWMWRNAETIAAHRRSEPTTLSHGDVHAGNLVFDNDVSSQIGIQPKAGCSVK